MDMMMMMNKMNAVLSVRVLHLIIDHLTGFDYIWHWMTIYSSISLARNACVRKGFGYWIFWDFGIPILYIFIMHKIQKVKELKLVILFLTLLDHWAWYTKHGILGDD
jgi:hypothetical protein